MLETREASDHATDVSVDGEIIHILKRQDMKVRSVFATGPMNTVVNLRSP